MTWVSAGRGFIAGTLSTATIYSVYTSLKRAGTDDSVHIEFEEGKPKVDRSKLERGRVILKYGIPSAGGHVRYYTNHALVYDQANKRPLWVAEHLTAHNLKGSANRKHSAFKPDPDLLDMFSASNEDYKKSGWSRGHMAPAGNNKYHQSAMDETFYLSNILPQDLDNNSGFWNRFEMYCRDLTKTYEDVRVISGPLVLPNYSEDGKMFVKYQVIGDKQVPVPTHLYKVILAEDSWRNLILGAFVVPNKHIATTEDELSKYQVPLEVIEEKSGMTFFEMLDRSVLKNLCSRSSCKLMSSSELALYGIARQIQNSRDVQELDRAWNRLNMQKLKPDQFLIDLYNKQKQELKKRFEL